MTEVDNVVRETVKYTYDKGHFASYESCTVVVLNLFHSTEDAGVLKTLPFSLNGLLPQTTSINMGMFGIAAFTTSSSLQRKYRFPFIPYAFLTRGAQTHKN